MFQDTLLIIKCDYLHKRKALLICLLQQGFQLQGQRKILFTPELAAKFYEDLAEDPCFMFQVILLSKGNSEAFILAKECAVEELFNLMICHFGTSTEMEKNVHVTKCQTKVGREISFIFPNYILEPIYRPEKMIFCSNNALAASLIGELYDIVTKTIKDPHKSWKVKLAEWLLLSNKSLPHISNQCCHNPKVNLQEIAQQTKITSFNNDKIDIELTGKCSLTDGMNFDTDGTSLNITSSSCISCSGFGSADECRQQLYKQPLEDIIKAKTASLNVQETFGSLKVRNVEGNYATEWLAEEYTGEEIEPVIIEYPLTLKSEHIQEDLIKANDVEGPNYTGGIGTHDESVIVEAELKSEKNNITGLYTEVSEPNQAIEPVLFDEYEDNDASKGSSIDDEEYISIQPAKEENTLPDSDDAAPAAE